MIANQMEPKATYAIRIDSNEAEPSQMDTNLIDAKQSESKAMHANAIDTIELILSSIVARCNQGEGGYERFRPPS